MSKHRWIEETLDLPRRVESLPLEKLKMGRRTLKRVRWLIATGLSLSIAMPAAAAACAVLGSPHISVRALYGTLAVAIFLLLLRRFAVDVHDAWKSGRKDGPAEAWRACEQCSLEGWKRGLTSHLPMFMMGLLAFPMLRSMEGRIDPPSSPLMAISFSLFLLSTAINLSILNVIEWGIRGLHGLCRDSEPKQPAPAKQVTLRERLLGTAQTSTKTALGSKDPSAARKVSAVTLHQVEAHPPLLEEPLSDRH